MFPAWMHMLSIAGLALGLICALCLLVDVIRHPQEMAVMNVVWPVTAIFGSLVTVIGYYHYGRSMPHQEPKAPGQGSATRAQPHAAIVAKGTLHCGAGCMLGDLIAEWLAFAVPGVALAFGWHTLFREEIFAVWLLDFVFAFGLGIVFQYFAIQPMRHLSPGAALVAAIKADALSLTAWQVGMYGLMAIAQFWLLPHAFGGRAAVDTPEFWFVMQLAMVAGFVTAYPVNAWLIRAGLKEKM